MGQNWMEAGISRGALVSMLFLGFEVKLRGCGNGGPEGPGGPITSSLPVSKWEVCAPSILVTTVIRRSGMPQDPSQI